MRESYAHHRICALKCNLAPTYYGRAERILWEGRSGEDKVGIHRFSFFGKKDIFLMSKWNFIRINSSKCAISRLIGIIY